jgi:hypothetical protein
LAYALCTAVMCFAHYFVVFVVASHFVLLLAQPDRYRLVARWCLFMVIVAVLWIPWVPAFIDQLTTPGNLSRYGSSWRAQIGATPVVYSVGRTFAWRESGKMMLALAAAASIIGFVVPAVLGVLIRHPKSRLSAPLLVSWVLLPIAIPLIVALTLTPMYHHRYASVGFVAFVILVAMGLVALRGPYRLIALLVIGSSTTYSMWNYYTKPLKEDWRSAAQAILAHRTADQIVLTDTDIEVVPLQYYTRRAGVALPMVYGLVVDADRDELTSVLHLNGRKIDDRPRDYTKQILSARSVTLALCVPARTAESYQAQFERRGFRTTRTQQFHRITVLNFEKVH